MLNSFNLFYKDTIPIKVNSKIFQLLTEKGVWTLYDFIFYSSGIMRRENIENYFSAFPFGSYTPTKSRFNWNFQVDRSTLAGNNR